MLFIFCLLRRRYSSKFRKSLLLFSHLADLTSLQYFVLAFSQYAAVFVRFHACGAACGPKDRMSRR